MTESIDEDSFRHSQNLPSGSFVVTSTSFIENLLIRHLVHACEYKELCLILNII